MGMGNFALIGPPGSGKSSIAQAYSQIWRDEAPPMQVLDIDEEILTPALKTNYPMLTLERINPITLGAQFVLENARDFFLAEKVRAMTTQQFLEWEASVTSQYPFEGLINTIISTTGSNPLRPTVMARIRNIGPVVNIKVSSTEVAERLLAKEPTTGIDRITGISEHGSLEALLKYRDRFYEAAADISFTPTPFASPDTVVSEFTQWAYDQRLHLVANNWKTFKPGVSFDTRAQALKTMLLINRA